VFLTRYILYEDVEVLYPVLVFLFLYNSKQMILASVSDQVLKLFKIRWRCGISISCWPRVAPVTLDSTTNDISDLFRLSGERELDHVLNYVIKGGNSPFGGDCWILSEWLTPTSLMYVWNVGYVREMTHISNVLKI